ncbi:MAG TPA: type IV toxin-antitoxin system AbiEi family antitoxin [Kofleriaceae bacterium]|nr:type IV toxin-antitoxin system AbiEi family antitoxin [Kofleriaceae bacterium]
MALGLPTLETADVASKFRISTKAANKLLGRLSRAGLIMRLRAGLWLTSRTPPSAYSLVEPLAAPFGAYVSLHSALYHHGMIEQIPAVVYAVSLGRTRRIRTPVATFSFHHIAPELFDGFKTMSGDVKLATPEKALFDVAYFSGGRSRLFAHLPELELPKRFSRSALDRWVARIPAARRRSMTASRIQSLLTPR